jgi:uncharacterized protein (UPF0332 family)
MTPEQQQLLEKAHSSLRAAKILSREEIYDAAVSRAYYTMFYIAEAFLLGENLTFSKHSAVISKFGEYFARTGRVPVEFHRNIIQAEQSRIKADYDATSQVSKTEANEQITHAETFLTFAQANL